MLTRTQGLVHGQVRGLPVLLAALVVLPTLPAQRGATKPTAAPETVPELVARAEAKKARTGVVVLDAEGKRIYAHEPEALFAPASNQKLLTAIAALETLGPAFTFRTEFRLRGGVLEVLPGGDPCWRSGGDHDPARMVANVVAALQKQGVTAVRGIVVLDGGFKGPERPDTWPKDQLDRLYCPPTGGLVFEEGAFRARVTAVGDTAAIEVLAPPVSFPIEGAIRVGTPAKGKHAGFSLLEAGGKLLARGLVAPGAKPQEVSGLVQDPALVVQLALRQALARAGIPEQADAPALDAAVHVETSTLFDALRPMLKESSNFHAEQVLRVLGRQAQDEGSFAAGVRAVDQALHKLVGKLADGIVCVDGSGLSRDNRVSPTVVARLLHLALTRPYAGDLRDALPLGGVDGTLDHRFKDKKLHGRVFAKTGYIRGVSALSGYALGDDGQMRVFSILMNWDPDGKQLVGDAKEIQEKIVEAIVKRRIP